MALSDELAKQVSERYCLIKITPSLRLNTLLSVKSGTIYTCTFTNTFELSSVKVDGTAYTESTTVDPTASKYYYNVTTGVFEINFNAAIGTKQAILFFNLRFTDSEYSVYNESGVKNAVSSYAWQSRIGEAPDFDVSIKDMLSGVTSISSSRFSVKNDDLWMNSYIGSEYSYFNKDVTVWLCVNQLVSAKFSGSLKDITPNNDDYSFSIYDHMYKLNESCLMGDTNEDAYYNTTTYTTMDPGKMGNVIPYVIGRSKYKFKNNILNTAVDYFDFDENETEQAVCLTIADSLTWGICRSGPNGFKKTNYGDINSGSMVVNATLDFNYGNASANRRSFYLSWSITPPNIEVGDTIEIVSGGTTYQGCVLYSVYQEVGGYMEAIAPAGSYANVTTSPNDSIGIMILQGTYRFYPLAVNDYTLTTTTLASGNKLYKVVFSAGFEARHPGMATIDYLNTKIYYRFTEKTSVTDDTSHAKVVSRVLTAAGLTVNAASITAVDALFTAYVNMTIPEFGSKTPKNYTDYLELLLKSSFGYIYRDNSTLETMHKLFAVPSAANLILYNEVLMVSVQFNGSEMAANLRALNDNIYFLNTNFTANSPYDPVGVSSSTTLTKSKYHHGLTNQKDLHSVFTRPSASLTVNRKGYSENVQMIVDFTTSSKYSNLNIGDDVAIYDTRIPGTKSTYQGYSCSLLKIIGIKYSSSKIIFTAIDFKVA